MAKTESNPNNSIGVTDNNRNGTDNFLKSER